MTCACTCYACSRCEGKPLRAGAAPKLRTLDANVTTRRRVVLKALAGGEIRHAEFRGRDHVVVPIVALKEGVIFASNAETPELVLASEFGAVPESWNGRPVMMDHPEDNEGRPVLANAPSILERAQLGAVFAARLDGKSLKMEAWLDPEMMKTAEAQNVLTRINAGQIVDVSVGVLVDCEAKRGSYNGQDYDGVWRGIVPDHLAMLPPGKPGACSVEMGCGGPRNSSYNSGGDMKPKFAEISGDARDNLSDADFAAVYTDKDGNKVRKLPIHDKAHADNAAARLDQTDLPADVKAKAREKIQKAQEKFGEKPKTASGLWGKIKQLRTRMAAEIRAAGAMDSTGGGMEPNPQEDIDDDIEEPHMEGQSDDDLRMDLESQLYAVEPGFVGVHSVFQGNKTVAYGVAPEGEMQYKMRSYEQGADGEVSLKDDAQECEMKTQFVPKNMTAAASSCGCGGLTNAAKSKEVDMSVKKGMLIAAILAAKGTPFVEADVPTLEAFDEPKLKALSEKFATEATTVAAPVVVETPKAETPEQMRERLLNACPDVKRIVEQDNTRRATRHAELVAAMKENKAFTEDELKAMPIELLEKIAAAAGKVPKAASNVVDFSGNGLPRDQFSSDEQIPVPKHSTLKEKILASRKQKSA